MKIISTFNIALLIVLYFQSIAICQPDTINSKIKTNNSTNYQINEIEFIKSELKEHRVKEDFFSDLINLQLTVFTLIVGFIGLGSWIVSKREINILKKEFSWKVKSFEEQARKIEVNMLLDSAILYGGLGKQYIDNNDKLNAVISYLNASTNRLKRSNLLKESPDEKCLEYLKIVKRLIEDLKTASPEKLMSLKNMPELLEEFKVFIDPKQIELCFLSLECLKMLEN